MVTRVRLVEVVRTRAMGCTRPLASAEKRVIRLSTTAQLQRTILRGALVGSRGECSARVTSSEEQYFTLASVGHVAAAITRGGYQNDAD